MNLRSHHKRLVVCAKELAQMYAAERLWISQWMRLQSAISSRFALVEPQDREPFVRKIVKMVEDFEIE